MSSSLIVYGINTVITLLEQQPERVASILISDKKSNKEVEQLASTNNIRIERMTKQRMDKMCGASTVHQGIAAAINSWPYHNEDELYSLAEERSDALILILDGVQDPHNLGACLRTADAAGVDAVIVPKDNSAPLSAVVAKVSSGAAFTVPLYRVSNLSRCIAKMQDSGVWFIGTDGASSSTIYDVDCKGNIAIVMGAEGRGMRDLTKKSCDHLISLPMNGMVESLNVAVAAGVCMYEVLRQRMS